MKLLLSLAVVGLFALYSTGLRFGEDSKPDVTRRKRDVGLGIGDTKVTLTNPFSGLFGTIVQTITGEEPKEKPASGGVSVNSGDTSISITDPGTSIANAITSGVSSLIRNAEQNGTNTTEPSPSSPPVSNVSGLVCQLASSLWRLSDNVTSFLTLDGVQDILGAVNESQVIFLLETTQSFQNSFNDFVDAFITRRNETNVESVGVDSTMELLEGVMNPMGSISMNVTNSTNFNVTETAQWWEMCEL